MTGRIRWDCMGDGSPERPDFHCYHEVSMSQAQGADCVSADACHVVDATIAGLTAFERVLGIALDSPMGGNVEYLRQLRDQLDRVLRSGADVRHFLNALILHCERGDPRH